MKSIILAGIICLTASYVNACTPTPTTASGWSAPQGFCSGQLIFEDNFDNLDHGKWYHEVTMAGGGNYEFQWYVNDRFNSYTAGGNLHIKPSFTSDIFGNDFLYSGRVIIPPEECTHSWNWGCDRTGSYNNIINPIRSAILTSTNSFSFKYGTLEIRAKAPGGDWLWPALAAEAQRLRRVAEIWRDWFDGIARKQIFVCSRWARGNWTSRKHFTLWPTIRRKRMANCTSHKEPSSRMERRLPFV